MWTPTKQVIDTTAVIENLLAYVEEFGADALAWANNGTALPDFAALYPNASGRLNTIFPALMMLDQRQETNLTGDVLEAGLELTLEGVVAGSNADNLFYDTRKYGMAVESLLTNITAQDLMAGTIHWHDSSLVEIGTAYDILRGDKTANAYLQIFQTKVLYKLATGS